ncbi:Pancreatic alpha-amylase precursor isoform 9-like protein [Camelus ferus]|nr:Pancreatic alpha-amylase precursor isoform 9-like protein [Camelus ferus]
MSRGCQSSASLSPPRGDRTLLVRHLPAELTAEEKEDLLKYFGAQSVRVLSDKGRLYEDYMPLHAPLPPASPQPPEEPPLPDEDEELSSKESEYESSDDEDRQRFDIRLMKEGRMKGQAFIGLPNEKAAAKALKEANGYVLFGKPMVVVHIYVDAVINHMCGSGVSAGTSSTCGSYFNPGTRDFPAVPYSGWDFNDGKCTTGSGDIESYNDPYQVRDCRLVGLLDLALEKDYVRSTIANYLNRLIDIGVAGFRIDASKHMWPGDMKAILDQLNNLNTNWFPAGSKPFIYQEVIDLGSEPIKSSEYYENGRVTEFKYGAKLGTVIRKWDGEKMAYLKNMVMFRNVVDGQSFTNWWDNGNNQVAFGRGNKGFIVFNNDDS